MRDSLEKFVLNVVLDPAHRTTATVMAVVVGFPTCLTALRLLLDHDGSIPHLAAGYAIVSTVGVIAAYVCSRRTGGCWQFAALGYVSPFLLIALILSWTPDSVEQHPFFLFVAMAAVFAAVSAAWGSILGLRSAARRAKAAAQTGICRACGYDLRATPERCPECGTIVVAGPAAVGESAI